MTLVDYLKSRFIYYTFKEEEDKLIVHEWLPINKSITSFPRHVICLQDVLSGADVVLENLPDTWVVKGQCDLEYVNIKQLPKNMSVGRWLDIGYTQITELPETLKVGGKLVICGTPIKYIPPVIACEEIEFDYQDITNIVSVNNCGYHKRTLNVYRVNNTIKVNSGCFHGSLEEFITAVNVNALYRKEYKALGEEYKAQAIALVERYKQTFLK